MTEAWFTGAATMDPILTRNPEKQKDQENGQKENGSILKTQRNVISNDGRKGAEEKRRKLVQDLEKSALQPRLNSRRRRGSST
mmetsp:Transcript_43850/g.81078  ORF Transcript_43850/g.81078 Transcript_43850/m.81078 type:complete len:83 (+) Transcript_43850:93-341(+)